MAIRQDSHEAKLARMRGEKYICPSCNKELKLEDFTDLEYDFLDETHTEGTCPYCNKFCCFTCEHCY